jgi:hypothetical protein
MPARDKGIVGPPRMVGIGPLPPSGTGEFEFARVEAAFDVCRA